HLTRQQYVLTRLRHRTVRRRHHQNRTVHLRRARDHVLHVVRVPRTVHVRVVPVLALVLHVRRRYRDPTRLLLRRLVDLVELARLPAELRRHHRRQRRRQRRLTMVHVTNRPNIHVRLRSLKFRLRHWNAPDQPFAGPRHWDGSSASSMYTNEWSTTRMLDDPAPRVPGGTAREPWSPQPDLNR